MGWAVGVLILGVMTTSVTVDLIVYYARRRRRRRHEAAGTIDIAEVRRRGRL